MRKIILGVGLAITSLSLTAAAAFETRTTRLQAIKTVGIISAVGEEMSVTRAGLDPVEHVSQSVPVESWGLDDLIVRQATALLNGRFRVQPVSIRAQHSRLSGSRRLVPSISSAGIRSRCWSGGMSRRRGSTPTS